MRRLRSSLLVCVAACGAPHTFHKDPEAACGGAKLVLAARDDVTILAGCTRAGEVHVRPAGPLDLAALSRLEVIESLLVGPSVGLEQLSLPRLREVRGTLRVVSNGNLRGVVLPALERAGRVELEGNVAITSVALPKLVTTSALVVSGNPDLELLDIASLTTLAELVVADNAKLVMIELGNLTVGSARVENNAMLPDDVRTRLAP